MKKALVTGAAGFIGSNLVKVLLKEGIEVRAMVLPGEDTRNLVGLDVEKVEGNVLEPPSLERAIAGCDTLFHLAAIFSIWEKDRSIFYKVNLQGSRNMLWTARRAEVEKIVYTSSIAGLGVKPGFDLGDEETEFNQFDLANDYVLTKYLSQEEAITFAREGLPLVVVNPCFPFGEGDKQPTPTGKMIVDVVNGTNKMYFKGGLNVVDVMDVARGHFLAAKKGKIGEKYILGNQNFTIREFFKKIAQIAGVSAPFIPSSIALAKCAGRLFEEIANVTGKPPLTTAKEVPYIAQNLFFNVTKAKEQLGLELTPIEDSIRRSIDWFRREGYITK
jgi:dihydroflavonol-4-reductase